MTSCMMVVIGVTAFSLTESPLVHIQTTPTEFTTALGKTLVLPSIDDMECDEMETMLSRIDSTGYRENAPTPHDEADAPLFSYELMLAEENYNRCVITQKFTGNGLFLYRRLEKK